MERLHLERFRFDQILRTGRAPFNHVEEGGNPPDFVVETLNGMERWDCAAFGLKNRRTARALFERLRERLLESAKDRDFSGIAGSSVSVWFGDHLDGLPPKKRDDTLIEPLLKLLEESTVDHDANKALIQHVAANGFPSVMPPVFVTKSTPDNTAGFSINIVCEPSQAASLPGGLGFVIDLHAPQQMTTSEAVTELQRIVDDHDKGHIDHLLVTAGGPDRRGIRYPAEEAFASLLTSADGVVITAKHLKSLTIHFWSDGDALMLPITSGRTED
jgi:hypothetical protein